MAFFYSSSTTQGSLVPATITAAPLTPALTPGDAPAILRSWQVGQILNAQVLPPAQDGATMLRVNGVVVSTQTSLSLTPGQTLQLKVVNTDGLPMLQIINPQAPQPPATADTLNQSLRTALPRQTPLSPLLANLGWLARADGSSVSTLPSNVVETARQVFSALPAPQELSTGAGLSASLQRSGVFLEAHLNQANITALETDFKAGLLRLREVLLTREPTVSAPSRPASGNLAPLPSNVPSSQTGTSLHTQERAAPLPPPAAPPPLRGTPLHAQPSVTPTLAEPGLHAEPAAELLSQVEGGLARVQLSQLASLPNNPPSPPAWSLELPVRHAGETHVIQLRIEADAQSPHPDQAAQERTTWSVTLALDLKGLGPLHTQVSLRQGKVSAAFRADRGETVKLLTQYLDRLRSQMSNAGLDVASITCAAGCPPLRSSHASLALLDVKI